MRGKGRCRSSSPSGGFLHSPFRDRRGSYFHMGSVWIRYPFLSFFLSIGKRKKIQIDGEMNPRRLRTLIVCCCAIAGHAGGSYRQVSPLTNWVAGCTMMFIFLLEFSIFIFICCCCCCYFLTNFLFLFIFGLLSRADRIGTTFSVSLPLPPSSSLLFVGRFIQIGGPLIYHSRKEKKKSSADDDKLGLIFPSFF